MKYIRSGALALAAAAGLAGCGGGGDDNPPPERATIVTAQLAGQATTAQIDAGTQASGIQALTGTAKCNVDIRYVLYITRDPRGEVATASEGVLVPSGSDPACTGSRPVLLYAHGTTTAKSKNMADVVNDSEASLLMAMYAAQGFIVVAPNYLGYDKSSLAYHPYLNAEASAIDMVDGLRAAKAHLNAASSVKPSDKLFVSGYSQGGHVAMATHRAIERDYGSEFTVTAAGPMSGPYNLVGFADKITTTGPVAAGSTVFLPMMLTSYQKSYGNIYAKTSDVYQSPFDVGIETLFPTDTPLATLVAQGKLPADPTFTALFGTGGLLLDSFKASYATSNFRKALVANTLAGADGGTTIGWKPKRPVALCGGAQDPTVFWAANAPVAKEVFKAQGVTVQAWDLESQPAVSDPTYPVYAGFAQAKAQTAAAAVTAGATDGGVAAVRGAYHGTLVPPFCTALERGFFQYVLASGL
jgi:acetyl esterase/lipase